MSENNVRLLPLSASAALQFVRRCSDDSLRVFYSPHARARMLARAISAIDVQRCLRSGVIEEGPFMNEKGLWQITMRRRTAGSELRVVAALDLPTHTVIVTTFRGRV